MQEFIYTVKEEDKGLRLDKFIALKLGEEYSRTYVKFLIDSGLVNVGGENEKPRYLIKEGEKVFVEIPPMESLKLDPEDIPLNILYEDETIIVLDKAAGMVVHPGAGNKSGTLVNALLFHCGKLPEADDFVRPGIVHRLDKDTTGVMVIAKNDKALRSLSKQFQQRVVKKSYFALVKGVVEMDNGVIDAPLSRHPQDRKKMTVNEDGGKYAKTVYHVVKRFKKFTILSLEPETGRTHQIRVHMKHLGYPVLGDHVYGGANLFTRQALHAAKLSFTHPENGKHMEFISPVPADIKHYIEKTESEEG